VSIELVKAGTAGVFVRIPEEVYRAAPGVNISALKRMLISPAHYLHNLAEEKEDTEALTFGTLLHSALLDPEPKRWVVQPEKYGDKKWSRRATYCVEWEAAQTLPILTAETEALLKGCIEAVRGHWVGRMLGKAASEVVGMMRDEETGLLMKGRADALAMDSQEMMWIFDLKTVRSGHGGPDKYGKQAADYDLHLQAAWYMRLFGATKFAFVAVEKEPPYAVGVYQISETDLALSDKVNRVLLRRLKVCADSGKFPGYSEDIETLSLPVWKRNSYEKLTA